MRPKYRDLLNGRLRPFMNSINHSSYLNVAYCLSRRRHAKSIFTRQEIKVNNKTITVQRNTTCGGGGGIIKVIHVMSQFARFVITAITALVNIML